MRHPFIVCEGKRYNHPLGLVGMVCVVYKYMKSCHPYYGEVVAADNDGATIKWAGGTERFKHCGVEYYAVGSYNSACSVPEADERCGYWREMLNLAKERNVQPRHKDKYKNAGANPRRGRAARACAT